MRLDDLARDREAEACAFSLRREEGIEDARAYVVRDAASAIVNADHDAHAIAVYRYVDLAAIRHRLACIAEHI